MVQINPIEHKGFIVVATSTEVPMQGWRSAFHISVDSEVFREEEIRTLYASKIAAESEALVIAKKEIDSILDGASSTIVYRNNIVKIVVGRIQDGSDVPGWHATVVIESGNRLASIGFIEVEPADTLPKAALNGLLAGQMALDKIISSQHSS